MAYKPVPPCHPLRKIFDENGYHLSCLTLKQKIAVGDVAANLKYVSQPINSSRKDNSYTEWNGIAKSDYCGLLSTPASWNADDNWKAKMIAEEEKGKTAAENLVKQYYDEMIKDKCAPNEDQSCK